MTVLHKKAPSTLIDDCIDKFHQHEVERKRLRLLNGQRGSTESPPVEFVVGAEGDPLSAVLTKSIEDPGEGPGVEDMSAGRDESNNYSFIAHALHLLYISVCLCCVFQVKACLAAPVRAASAERSPSASWRILDSRSLKSFVRAAAAWQGACRGSRGRA